MRFIGREYEMERLARWYEEDRFQCIVMYGRRRVGKTRLLTEFSKGKNTIFHVATEHSETRGLQEFSAQIMKHYQLARHTPLFARWEDAFAFLGEQAKDERTLLILDEFPYLARSHMGMLSILQNSIDHIFADTKLFIVLCGSSISFMEHEVLSYKSPLFGRRTGQMEIPPLDYFHAKQFFPSYNAEDSITAYGVLGGIPQYLQQFSPDRSLDDNMQAKVFDKTSYLYREPEFLIKQELKSPAVYISIIEAIAGGASKLNDIATAIKESTAKTSVYMRNLLRLRIIDRITPIGEKKSRKTIYRISDSLFDFFYRFINPYIAVIEQELGDLIYETEVKGNLSSYLGFVFEQVCKEYLIRRNRKQRNPFLILEIGRWWGPDKAARKQEEIDIVGTGKDCMLFAECTFTNKLVGIREYKKLVSRSELIAHTEAHYILFSKSGFEEQLITMSRNLANLELITLDDMISDIS